MQVEEISCVSEREEEIKEIKTKSPFRVERRFIQEEVVMGVGQADGSNRGTVRDYPITSGAGKAKTI